MQLTLRTIAAAATALLLVSPLSSAPKNAATASSVQSVICTEAPQITFNRSDVKATENAATGVPVGTFDYCAFEALHSLFHPAYKLSPNPLVGVIRVRNDSDRVWNLKPARSAYLFAEDPDPKFVGYHHRFPSRTGETSLAPGEWAMFDSSTREFAVSSTDTASARWSTYVEILANVASYGGDAASEAVREGSPTASAILKCVASGGRDYKAFHPESSTAQQEKAKSLYEAVVANQGCISALTQLPKKNEQHKIHIATPTPIKMKAAVAADEGEGRLVALIEALVNDCFKDCPKK